MMLEADELLAVSPEDRDELLRDVLILLERFNDRHGYGFDLFARLDLLESVLAGYADWFATAYADEPVQ
jgi:hypothetical protein